MAVEVAIAQDWMFDRLAGDATLATDLGTNLTGLPSRIHEDNVPGGGALPAVVIQYQGGADFQIVGPDRVWSDMLFVVKVSNQTPSTQSLRAAAASIDRLLHAQSGPATGGRVEACIREQPFKLAPVESGKVYKQLGGIYRLQVRATS